MTDLRPKEFIIFNVYDSCKPNKDGTFKPEDCDRFIQDATNYFHRKIGAKPTLLIIPKEHTGETKLDGIRVEYGAKPRGHYLLGFDS